MYVNRSRTKSVVIFQWKMITAFFTLLFCCLFLLLLLFPRFALANQRAWNAYVQQLRTEAIAQGIRPQVFDAAFQNIHEPHRRVLHLDRTQPEKRLTFLKYRNTRADRYRIILGRREIKKHQQKLNEIGRAFGVSPCFIVSLWGLETSYGRYMGKFPVIKSLATLAYDNRRAAFFRKQLFLALHILNDGHVSLENFKGEWAGASGHPQFLPSSWHKFAVDYNGNGRKDIWTNLDDAFASIANYLVKNGWKSGEPWAVPVNVPSRFNQALITSKVAHPINKTVSEWRALGVLPKNGHSFPKDKHLTAALVKPYGGPTMMIFNNFKVLMRWNRSIYYAGTVGYAAEEICQRTL